MLRFPDADAAAGDSAPAEPTGQGELTVQEGDCMSSIADATGHFWETLWNLPENAALKAARKDPNVLLPGDQVTVPPVREKDVPCATGKRHVFRRRGVPERLRLRLLRYGEPRRGEPFLLEIAASGPAPASKIRGTTTADGWIEVYVPPGATRATLALEGSVTELDIGHLDPVDSRSGAEARLRNLGLFTGEPGDDEAFRMALGVFQRQRELEVTWALDRPTQAALVDAYVDWTGLDP